MEALHTIFSRFGHVMKVFNSEYNSDNSQYLAARRPEFVSAADF